MKQEPNDAGDFRLALSLRVNYDKTWEVVIIDLSDALSSFPKVIYKLSDLKQLLSYLDDMVLCCGNSDAKYDILI